ncbi:TetR/AcrR family transcriptional regulator [Bradyrhizobium sp. ISRA443]|uniref:TetR/AcrR family transcriptional regulator n=1 Tax=unclassified Bradyrhizobium TaxID=2631580 RepID=UPI002478DD68|nr:MULTISPECIES: TetR/AcrR family transcriptional regulator [unclassified Bradyrhizobium]WGR94040.1 TetR/AcrR family transcriptional regulator [Bradyrhizobium sp. ISRA435]WGR98675.1 TetR/AcrR family transcriptional regulator [Bradyrhizobium sp. ISRA436]WGS05564.1 TetR/AcrR family transcriptional regulator [Bradyrhizobium sp. ISRA437]WGS12451.1 TetR/AcrR family transcriptional regulator [Bradyrhizobium sp. ISRA443]
MNTRTLKKTPSSRPKRAEVRLGRPPKELIGEVDERILDAARMVFLQRGFEGASIDEIAEVARSGKRTIYARFADKRALFTEVVTRDILVRIAEYKVEAPTGATVEERLTSAASTMLHWGLDTERIGLMRLAIAEARRFPDLAATVNRRARELSTELGVHLLRNLTQSDELGTLPAFAPEHLATTARLFLDLVAVPMLLRALYEVDLKVLDPEIDAHVARAVAFFLAACRNGWVEAHAR